MAKMQKMIAVIGMMAAMVFGFNSCTKSLELESPEQSTSWGQPKKLENKKITVWEELSEKFSFFAKFEKGGNTLYETSYERPFGAYGEATHVVPVEAESELSGVKYVEGKPDTQKSEWDAKNGWWGTQVTRTQAFRLENAKYGADYSDSWYSTDAHFEKDTLKAEFPDAIWNRSVKLDSTDVYNKSIDGSKAYYKVRDYVATVTNVASIKDGFVKDAQKASKTFTMKDTLSLRFYVEPDPEDEFVRRWDEVELYKEDGKIVGEWIVKEEWTISKVREVYKKTLDFTAWAKGSDNNPVYPTNTAYQIVSEKWNGTGNKAIATTSSNGIKADEFKTHFEVYGDESVTLTYEDQSVTFNAKMVQASEAVKQDFGKAELTLINGVYYNISLYTAEILPVYTVTAGEKNAKLELSAKGETQLRVKANANVKVENQEFKANFKAEGAKLYHEDGQYANSWDEVEYTETVETGRNNVVRNLYLNGNVNSVDSYEVEDASMLGQLKLSSIKGNANSTSKKDGNFNVKTVVATVTATFDNKKAQTIDFKVTSETAEGMSLGFAAIDFDKISCKIDTVRVAENTMKIVPNYTVPVVITKLDGKTETKDYVIYNPFYEVVKAKPADKVDTVYTPSVANGQLVVLVERVVNDKDRTEIRTDKYTPNFGITAQNAKDMYGKNYATTYNGTRNVKTNTVPNGYWTVENTKGQMTSTLSNGADSDDNIADYGFDSKVTYTDGDYSYTWEGKMVLSNKTDALVPAGTKTINNIVYNVFNYQENFNGVYTIDGNEIGKPADAVKRQILVKVVTTTEIENKRYEAIFETSGANLTTKVNANSWDVVTYTDGVETGRKTETHPLEVSANISGATNFSVDSKDNLNKEYKITSVTRTGNQVTTYTDNDGVKKEKTVQNFNATVNNGQTLNVRVVTEEDLTEGMTLSHTYCETVKAKGINANVNGNTVTLTPQVNVMLVQDNGVATKAVTGEAKAYTIEDSMVGTYTPETKVVRVPSIEGDKVVVRTYNDVDGDRTLVDEEYHSLYSTLKAQAGSDVYAENYSFTTTYNGKRNVTTTNGVDGNFTYVRENGQVYSTMSNGSVKEDNIADYSFDKTIVYKNGNDTFTFNGSSVLSENTDPITAAGKKGSYDAYAYSTTFNMAYSVDNISIANNVDAVKRNILVINAINIDKGKIKSIDITAVPGHSIGDERFADGSDRQDALKNFAIHTETGVYNVQFVMSEIIPSENQLKNLGTFTSGNYDEYNSACDRGKNGVWVPAKTEDASDALRWRLEDGKARSVRLESLQQWNWRNGDYSTVVTGYTYTVNNGVLTLKYNGNVVLIVK